LDRALVPEDLYLCEAEIPDELVASFPLSKLPSDWAHYPPGEGTRQIGVAWLASTESVALRVPSVVAPDSFNILLNPTHPDSVHIVAGECAAWSPDARLFDRSG
jgi:RES domain-containing protein